jgi:hypothetical protein
VTSVLSLTIGYFSFLVVLAICPLARFPNTSCDRFFTQFLGNTQMHGPLSKMHARPDQQDSSSPVQYELPLGDHLVALNPLIGKPIKLVYTGKIFCIHCNRSIKKSFNQGYCYPCFTSLAQCDLCIMKPETCHYAEGTCREPSWGETFVFSRMLFIWLIPAALRLALLGRPKFRHAG